MIKAKYPLLIDGGLSNELENQGCDLQDSLWTAKIIEDNPEAIIQAHLAYLKAGAKCILSSSYQASIHGFLAQGYSAQDAESLITKSVELAIQAVERFETNSNILIGASIGPYGAYLSNGSEYSGNYQVSDQTLTEFHQRKIDILDQTRADFLAIETIPNYQEANVLSKILSKVRKPSWVSFSCKNDHSINDGTDIQKCVELFNSNPRVFAIGVNCTPANYVSKLISRIKVLVPKKKIVVYPNSGAVYNAETKEWDGITDLAYFAVMAKEWLTSGADIIGGCCTIGPSEIASLREMIDKQ